MFALVRKWAAASAVFCLLAQAEPIPINLEERTAKQVYMRVEGETHTIFEGLVLYPYGRDITTDSGGTHHCDGTNNNAHPTPGPTCTSALAQAAKRAGFTFDGTYSSPFDDFFITRIGDSAQTSNKFWGILRDGQFTASGGCQEQVAPNQKVLWAYDAFNAQNFLGLALDDPDNIYSGQPFTATVTDTMTGNPVSGAQVGDQVSDATGKVTLTSNYPGRQSYKANKASCIRSNKVVAVVKPHSL